MRNKYTIERHFKLRDAAQLTGAKNVRTLKLWLAKMGYETPNGVDGRMVTVPESVIEQINKKYAVRLA